MAWSFQAGPGGCAKNRGMCVNQFAISAKRLLLAAAACAAVACLAACASLSAKGNYTAQAYSSLYVQDELSPNKRVLVECDDESPVIRRVTELAAVGRLKKSGVDAMAASSYESYRDAVKKEGQLDYVLAFKYGERREYAGFGGGIASVDFECTVERRRLLTREKIAKIVGTSFSKENIGLSFAESVEPACKRAGEAAADEYLSLAKKK